MSPISNFGLLALASTALAVPFAHENHRHLHARQEPGRPPVIGAGPKAPTVPTPNVPGVPDAPNPVAPIAGAISGKRGIAYNTASLGNEFAGSPLFGWAHNWISDPQGISNGVMYIPTLHNGEAVFLQNWASEAQAAINAGAKYIFGFNEPDIASQANMSPETAADLYRTHITPFQGKATLVAPAVSNSNNPGEGQDWLKQFMSLCGDCGIGAVNQHWYDSSGNDIPLFQQQIQGAHEATNLPVFVGEFGFIGDDAEISEALNQVMGWMDANDSILGYAYFYAENGYLLDNGEPSGYGLTYLNN